jgi:hypothetical protein
MKIQKLILALSSALLLVGCDPESDFVETPLGAYDNGVLVLNQGGFGAGNASVSFISDDFATSQNNIFSLVNPSVTFGDTAQDIGFYQNLGFAVLNGSNKIVVFNRYSLEFVTSINTGLSNPRYIAFANNKAYVTNWGSGSNPNDDFVAIINLLDYSVATAIPVIEGPEKIIVDGNNLYVAHAGGFNYGNKISVINSLNNSVTSTITVGDVPNSMQIKDSNLYVLCGGNPSFAPTETAGKLVKIALTNANAVATVFDFGLLNHPSNLVIADANLYYTVSNEIYKTTTTTTVLPTTPLFTTNAQGAYGIYSFAVHNNSFYIGDAGDYNSNGKVYVYSNSGSLNQDFTVGIIPAGFYFN